MLFKLLIGSQAMDRQRTHVVLALFWMIGKMSLLMTNHMASGKDPDFDLCVTSRQQIHDLSHQNLTNVPENLPNSTRYLDISYNYIEKLDATPFTRLGQLCFLKVTHCGLRVISPNLFDYIPKLQILNFSYNSLVNIPDLPLTQLKILDLGNNLYDSYQLPATFQNLTNLEYLSIGSTNVLSVNSDDFSPLGNISLQTLILGAGMWQKYHPGFLAKIKLLHKINLNVTFCKNINMLELLLADLNETQTRDITFVKLFPDKCMITGDPFQKLRTMHLIRNFTIAHAWMNSSFLVKLVKNALLSPLHKLAFVNIVYNQDTPDGFEAHLNRTSNMCSIIVDGVSHYQYEYPKVNISVDSISKLTYLKFSGSGMNISPCNLISDLPSLERLDLSNNLLDDSGFWWPTCSYTSVFPALRELTLSRNHFEKLEFIALKTHQMKNLVSLDLSFNSIRLEDTCSWPAQLRELSLRNNNLGNAIFDTKYLSPNFERIDLSKTGITAITQEILLKFPRLTHLSLSSNSIQSIPVDLNMPTLLSLYVDQNAITSVSWDSLDGLPKLQTLKAGNNPFACTCDSYWFLTAMNKSLLPDWPLDYYCSIPPSANGRQLSEYKMSKLECDTLLQVAIGLPVTVTIIAGFCFIFYICDGLWYTKMLWVWIRVKRRNKKRAETLMNKSFQYHAFISYSHNDSDWVDSQLVPALEGAGLSLCIHERDFVPGQWIIDNIINCVETSYKSLFVLSKHFVQSEWCNYELFFAQHRAINIQEDSLVFIILEPLPTESMPKKFLKLRTLLRQQTYLEWPNDERKQQVFWASLKSMLQVADKSLLLKDIALEIADTVPLLTDQR